MLISFNYLALYVVILFPFVLIFKKRFHDATNLSDEQLECIQHDDTEGVCADYVSTEHESVSALQYNVTMAIVNLSVLVYSLLCEFIMIIVQKKYATISLCNSYLLIQVLNGTTLRAMILISAQLVAVFI